MLVGNLAQQSIDALSTLVVTAVAELPSVRSQAVAQLALLWSH
jgi:hypothetical protein